jgi:hypothetical protein
VRQIDESFGQVGGGFLIILLHPGDGVIANFVVRKTRPKPDFRGFQDSMADRRYGVVLAGLV